MHHINNPTKNAVFERMVSLLIKAVFILLCFWPKTNAFGQQTGKIQEAINSIKTTYYCEDQDYHTDGQRIVWVKSYKKWIPADLAVLEKESPATLRFLGMAAQRSRYDVIEQLLPDYYRTHGGAKAFAEDIIKEQGAATTSPAN